MPSAALPAALLFAAAAASAALPVPAPEDGASVADFLARAQAIAAKGDAAAASPELAAMKAEVHAITLQYRADLARQKQTGEPPHSCPPARSGLTSSSLMAELNLVPPEKRRDISVKTVFYTMMKKRYPCAG